MLYILSCDKSKSIQSNLKVNQNGYFLETREGKPFFYLGDTGWELFHRLDRKEAEVYLETRKKQGFNVIQAVAIAELEGLSIRNAYHDLPLVLNSDGYEFDTTGGRSFEDSVAYDYWDHIAYIIGLAEQKGIYIALLPCWGEYVTPRFREKAIFGDTDQGYRFGNFIGKKLKDYKNIIWVLGGDRLPNEKANGIEIWYAMAEGINDAVEGKTIFDNVSNFDATLMSYHCFYPSTNWFENSNWLDFSMWGSYHEKRDNDRAFEIPIYQYQLKNHIPTINGEPSYELGNINYDAEGKFGSFDDFDVRQQAYWSVFAGCMGHTYGCGSVWQMYDSSKPFSKQKKLANWYDVLSINGANQMQYLKKLVEDKTNFSRRPAQEYLASNTHDITGHLQAMKGDSYLMVYTPTGKKIEVVVSKIKDWKLKTSWYNPRNGEYLKAEIEKENPNIYVFNPPGEESRGNDWVLILENL